MELTELLAEQIAKDASDLHLIAGQPPILRIAGDLIPQAHHATLIGSAISALLAPYLDERQKATLESGRDVDRTVRSHERRFLLHVFRERGGLAACLRIIPAQVPTLNDLGLGADTYPVLQKVIESKRGLNLIVGPSGSGKSTTVAALIEEINRTRAERIVTVEDPMVYEFKNNKSFITQRIFGEDTADIPAALRSMMQVDPDVIYVSEQRNLESILLTLTLADTGHLVFTVLNVNTASEAITRLVEMWPEGQQAVIRRLVAQNLNAVIAQKLVPRHNQPGRVPVNEILLGTPRVKGMIMDGVADLTLAMEAARDIGMQTMDDCLMRLHEQGTISTYITWLHLTDKGRLPQGADYGLTAS